MSDVPARFGAHDLRSEDAPLLQGRARFTDDINLPNQAHAVFVRAQMAHAELRGVNVAPALAMPGVIAVLTGADLLREGVGGIPPVANFPGRDGKPMFAAVMPALAQGRVRYVGEPIAIVVAETLLQAMDAADAVEVELDELPAVPAVEGAMASDAPLLFSERPSNVALDWAHGDAAAVDAAFASAAHVTRVKLQDPRMAPTAMEPRAALASWDAASQRLTLTASTQGVAIVRKVLAESVFKVPLQNVRVVTHDVGGGFGMKAPPYSEYAAIMFAARKLARPVKWCATRLESFLGDTHGRDCVLDGEMALDQDGRILGLRATSLVGLGAYTTMFAAIFGTANTKNCLSSVYRIPAIVFNAKLVLTNAAPLGPYRGAGRPEAIMLVERLIDDSARALGIDRIELRRRNFIPPSAMPYTVGNGMVYDSGEFEIVMDRALTLGDWSGFAARRAASESAGLLRGIGVGCFLEVAGGILDESTELRFGMDARGDFAALHTGAQAMGQGHLSTFVPLIAGRLQIDPANIRLVEGDSDLVPGGTPSVASRSMMMAGSAGQLACDAAIDKGRRVAAHLLEAADGDIEYAQGKFRIAGTDRFLGLFEVAKRARTEPGLPAELQGGLDNTAKFVSPQMSFPNGCHVCEVEIDPATGVVSVERYTAVDDVGRVMHEAIVEGQMHGGIAQGLAQVLGEQVVYDDNGQLLTASFMDYFMMRADDVPPLVAAHHVVPCTTNPLGVKGAGESGVAGALPSAISAVLDALRTRGVEHLDLPMTAPRVWEALQAVRATA